MAKTQNSCKVFLSCLRILTSCLIKILISAGTVLSKMLVICKISNQLPKTPMITKWMKKRRSSYFE